MSAKQLAPITESDLPQLRRFFDANSRELAGLPPDEVLARYRRVMAGLAAVAPVVPPPPPPKPPTAAEAPLQDDDLPQLRKYISEHAYELRGLAPDEKIAKFRAFKVGATPRNPRW